MAIDEKRLAEIREEYARMFDGEHAGWMVRDLLSMLDALLLAHALGERRHGHFDHDAHAVEGPPPADDAPVEGDGVAVMERLGYRLELDPATGDRRWLPR